MARDPGVDGELAARHLVVRNMAEGLHWSVTAIGVAVLYYIVQNCWVTERDVAGFFTEWFIEQCIIAALLAAGIAKRIDRKIFGPEEEWLTRLLQPPVETGSQSRKAKKANERADK